MLQSRLRQSRPSIYNLLQKWSNFSNESHISHSSRALSIIYFIYNPQHHRGMTSVIQDTTFRTEFLESSNKIQQMEISHAVRKTTAKNQATLIFFSCSLRRIWSQEVLWVRSCNCMIRGTISLTLHRNV